MPRRAKPKSQQKNWRWYASMGLNGLVAVSMVLGTVFLFTGAPSTAALPTIAAPTVDVNAPTFTPMPQAPASTPVAPTPTPPPPTATP
ncbi:MAG TPA: hypothetical protein VF429_00140 [Anaerolineae bacterium]